MKKTLFLFSALLSVLLLSEGKSPTFSLSDLKDTSSSIHVDGQGIILEAPMQKLSAQVNQSGLQVTSTETSDKNHQIQIKARRVGRADTMAPIPEIGVVKQKENLVFYDRFSIREVYQVGIEGIRQDFVIKQKPPGNGPLILEISIRGAKVKDSVEGGVVLNLNQCERELRYSKLYVVDADGKACPATMNVNDEGTLLIRVDDTKANYPLCIDPTLADADWFSMNDSVQGIAGEVFAMAEDSSSNLVIGGEFSGAGKTPASNVILWNGSDWKSMGSGLNGKVFDLVVVDGILYAAGSFTERGYTGVSQNLNHIAQWNGSEWQPVGLGVDGVVYDLEVIGNTLYAGGAFEHAGGNVVNSIAKWDGVSWSKVGNFQDFAGPAITCLTTDGQNLYVGGGFINPYHQQGYAPGDGIAMWDGTAWSEVGNGVSGLPEALCYHNGILYVGGGIQTVGGGATSGLGAIDVNNVARWDGSQWDKLDEGVNGNVQALAIHDGNLIIAGSFTQAGGITCRNIAQLDLVNGNWSDLDRGIHGYGNRRVDTTLGSDTVVNVLMSDSFNVLRVGGAFSRASELVTRGIAKWNGTSWSPQEPVTYGGIDGEIFALELGQRMLYIGGDFQQINGQPFNNIARWDGSDWHPMAGGVTGTVFTIELVNDDGVYVGGDFKFANFPLNPLGLPSLAVEVNNITYWDATTNSWSDLADISGQFTRNAGTNGPVYSIEYDHTKDEVYIGGYFRTAGINTDCWGIAHWDGNQWLDLEGGVEELVAGIVYALQIDVDLNLLLVGGRFTLPVYFRQNPLNCGDTAGFAIWGIQANEWFSPDDVGGGKWANQTSSNSFDIPTVYAIEKGFDAANYEYLLAGKFDEMGKTVRTQNGCVSQHVSTKNIVSLKIKPNFEWSNVSGLGVTGEVRALHVDHFTEQIFVGGKFNVPTKGNIAAWHNGVMHDIESGLNGTVNTIVQEGGSLYAGGGFTTAGQIYSPFLAKLGMVYPGETNYYSWIRDFYPNVDEMDFYADPESDSRENGLEAADGSDPTMITNNGYDIVSVNNGVVILNSTIAKPIPEDLRVEWKWSSNLTDWYQSGATDGNMTITISEVVTNPFHPDYSETQITAMRSNPLNINATNFYLRKFVFYLPY